MATPMDTGSAARPNHARLPIHCTAVESEPDDDAKIAASTRLPMLTAAPLASHLSCWRRSPDERRQLSTWRPMKAKDSTKRMIRHPWRTAAYQPAGLSRATRPPEVSIRTGCAASAPAVATTEAMSSTAKAVHQTQSAQRQ